MSLLYVTVDLLAAVVCAMAGTAPNIATTTEKARGFQATSNRRPIQILLKTKSNYSTTRLLTSKLFDLEGYVLVGGDQAVMCLTAHDIRPRLRKRCVDVPRVVFRNRRQNVARRE